MNLGTQKWKKARANFSGVRDDAGRCGTACMRACPWDAHCLPARGEITSFSKKPSFLGNHSKYVAKAKAKACSQGQGSPLWACCPRLGHAAAKAKAAPMGRHAAKAKACLRACCQGQGTQPRPWHACVGTLACPWVQAGGHAGTPLGAGRWARWHAPGRRQQQGPSMPRGRGRGMPRGWDAKAVACPWDPYKAMAALGGAAAAKPR
jgi:hypothetical protein